MGPRSKRAAFLATRSLRGTLVGLGWRAERARGPGGGGGGVRAPPAGELAATYGAVTNWATFARPLELDGVQQLHLPLLDWNASTPPSVFGAMVIFRPRAGRLAAFVGGSRAFVEKVRTSGMVGEAVL